MQTLKFRAWHKELKIMFPVLILDFLYKRTLVEAADSSQFVAGHGCFWDLKDIELMQWTGLQDSDAVDIYEGDIVCSESDEGYTCEKVIRLSSGLYMLECIYSGEQCTDLESCADSIEVMGNIYENSDLLNAPI